MDFDHMNRDSLFKHINGSISGEIPTPMKAKSKYGTGGAKGHYHDKENSCVYWDNCTTCPDELANNKDLCEMLSYE